MTRSTCRRRGCGRRRPAASQREHSATPWRRGSGHCRCGGAGQRPTLGAKPAYLLAKSPATKSCMLRLRNINRTREAAPAVGDAPGGHRPRARDAVPRNRALRALLLGCHPHGHFDCFEMGRWRYNGGVAMAVAGALASFFLMRCGILCFPLICSNSCTFFLISDITPILVRTCCLDRPSLGTPSAKVSELSLPGSHRCRMKSAV